MTGCSFFFAMVLEHVGDGSLVIGSIKDKAGTMGKDKARENRQCRSGRAKRMIQVDDQ